MILTPDSLEYKIFFGLTIFLLAVKFSLALYLGIKIRERKKKTGSYSFGFATSVFILMICIFIARLFWFYFDFYLTLFDETTYYLFPNYLYWKIAAFISVIGYTIVVFTVDRKIIDFKLKGVPSYIMGIAAIIILVYPVISPSDFQIISSLLFLANVTAIIIPVLFLYIGYKSPEYRKPAYIIAVGVIVYAIGANILIESLLAFLVEISGFQGTRIIIYFLSMILKTTGLIFYAWGVTLFVREFS